MNCDTYILYRIVGQKGAILENSSIDYTLAGEPYRGVLVYDSVTSEPRPSVLLAPDWMGVSDQAIASAQRIAAAGFVVFVADMYGRDHRPTNPAEAAALADPLKKDAAQSCRRATAALDTLRAEAERRHLATVMAPAAVGFCFGGQNVLELCRAGAALTAAISIHGDLGTSDPAAPGTIQAPILVLHGSADPVAPEAQRRAFEAEMQAAGAQWSMMVFGGAVHSFTDPGAAIEGVAMFEPTAARWAFRMTEQFLLESFADT